MSFSLADAVSVVQIAVYVPCFLLALVLCSRHGWAKSSGWAFLITFTCLRIISSASQLIDDSNPSKQVKTAYIITSSIGISPLTMLALGLLSRVYVFPPICDDIEFLSVERRLIIRPKSYLTITNLFNLVETTIPHPVFRPSSSCLSILPLWAA